MNVLEFQDVHITYRQKEAVGGVSLQVPENAIVALVGESGSGKSTLLRAAAGLLSADGSVSSGTVFFQGRSLAEYSEAQLRSIRGREMAMIFQNAGSYLNPRRRIGGQYLEMLRSHLPLSKEEAEKQAKETLRRLKLSDTERIWKSYPFQLSGGMQQRVAIAMAICMRPRLLLADEPTSALDVTVQAQVVQELLKLKAEMKTSILLITHNMGVASKMADYIAVMREGKIVETGRRDQIIFHPEHAYTKALLEAVPKLESEESVERSKAEHRRNYRHMHGNEHGKDIKDPTSV